MRAPVPWLSAAPRPSTRRAAPSFETAASIVFSLTVPHPTPTTTNPYANWSTYDRAADYPRAISLPLQYITTSTGDKLSVRVSVPANIWGKQASGQFPVILTQTAYRNGVGQILGTIATGDTTLIIGGKDDYMIRRGYITVAVDAWGTGMSRAAAWAACT